MIQKEKLAKLSLSKLIELKEVCNEMLVRYQNELSIYARINDDPSYLNISETERKKIVKTNLITNLVGVINNLIEEHVLSNYIKED